MNDKELLELAAKAARLPECGWMGPVFVYVKDNAFVDWDPLTDDGDALRLAVKLSMSLEKVVSSRGSAWIADHRAEEVVGTDSSATARRAIVRAAASIGEKMS